MLVERFVRAVREDGIAPGRILAITFTERAAGELRERVRARLLELGEREAARDTEGAPIGTFHGFCARLLRVHALAAGLDPDFAILDEAARGAAARAGLPPRARPSAWRAGRAAASHGADAVRSASPPTAPIAGCGAIAAGRRLPCSAAAAEPMVTTQPTLPPPAARRRRPRREAIPRPAERRADRGGGASAPARCWASCWRLRPRYAELKQRPRRRSTSTTSSCARALCWSEHEGVRAAWSERIELLMVDEFQDTNRRQLALLELLERDNLFTVGDELQSIYGFRHADVGSSASAAPARRRGAALALTHNFRSPPPLIAAINAIFASASAMPTRR